MQTVDMAVQEPCSPTSTLRTVALRSPPLSPPAKLRAPDSCPSLDADLLDDNVAASEADPSPAANQEDLILELEVPEPVPAPIHPPLQVRPMLTEAARSH